MRRALLSVFGIAALALATPGAALAHHHHHKTKSRAHRARVHFVHIGAHDAAPQSDPVVGEGDTKSASDPSMTSGEGAGKVVSFIEGVLTIALDDGSTVAGKVTSRTEIKCERAQTIPPATEGDKESEDSSTTSEDSNHEGDDKSGEEGDDKGSGDDEESAPEPPCDTSALTPGAMVREAELRISSTEGAEFESIELVR